MEYKEKSMFEEIVEQFEELKKVVYNIESLQNLLEFPSFVIDDRNAIEAIRHEIDSSMKDYRSGLRDIYGLIGEMINK